MQVYSVSEVTAHIKVLFDGDAQLQDVWVEGEVSNCVQSSAGHMYFTLKDARAQLRCVLWRSRVVSLEHRPENGKAVLVHGRASVYDAQGSYQLYVDWVQPVGTGALFLQLEELKAKLLGEGLFAPERKRSLPAFPQRLGVVTSPTGAALRDILQVLQRRFPLVEVILAPTLVQGSEAPAQIVAAIELLNAHADVDLIIVARGGGSLEELWAFNDERVARAIHASATPVVSGVGHETDFTIADLVADLRAPTPSAAAEIAVPDQHALCDRIAESREALCQAIGQELATRRRETEHALRSLRQRSPRTVLDRWRQTVDENRRRISTAHQHRLVLIREQSAGVRLRLEALNPRAILDRGYSVVARADTGAVVKHVGQVATGDAIEVQVSDGEFRGTVD